MKKRCLLSLIACTFTMAGAGGCISYATLHTAKPLDEGRVELTLSPHVHGITLTKDAEAATRVLPTGEIALRVGVHKDLDFGARIFPMGAAIDLNYALLNAPDLVVSINPYLSVTRLSDDFGSASTDAAPIYGAALLNLLADVLTDDLLTLTVGLKPGVIFGVAPAQDFKMGGGAVAGAMAALTIRLSNDISLMPNADLLMPLHDFGQIILFTGSLAFNLSY